MSRFCDFCFEAEPKVTFLCDEFELPELGEIPSYKDNGYWYACNACRDRIDDCPFEAVVAYAIITRQSLFGTDEMADFLLKQALEAFNEYRVGGSFPIDTELPSPPLTLGYFLHPSNYPLDNDDPSGL